MVQGLGVRVQGFGVRVEDLLFRVLRTSMVVEGSGAVYPSAGHECERPHLTSAREEATPPSKPQTFNPKP